MKQSRSLHKTPNYMLRLLKMADGCLLRQFPFAIWYVVADDGSVVIGCIHSKRHERLAAARIRGLKGPSPG